MDSKNEDVFLDFGECGMFVSEIKYFGNPEGVPTIFFKDGNRCTTGVDITKTHDTIIYSLEKYGVKIVKFVEEEP